MNRNRIIILLTFIALLTVGYFLFGQTKVKTDERFVSYTVDTKIQDLKFYWKNDKGEIFKSIDNLKNWLDTKNKKLNFAMNGGMFKKDNSPQGLFIDNGKQIIALDTTKGNGNFYLMPNGVFYITTDNLPKICKTSDYKETGQIKYATQSGPMLVIDGQIHSAFKEGSNNLNIRNGVGILPDNKLIFAMSRSEINFYDFADYFKKLGCKNALYLDGFVSRTYLPEQSWTQTDGNFGVIIGVTTNKK
ncbi:phosphodiester glycosidase family protein [Flavobacterium sp. UBA4197]|uniref:phosphodiester glycosidase family protein n=1 Tax=Flavobacterium sp. UBA4197 TaxID=1946546 RepID=UPI00257CF689|nr:phosphodiester glycosidase family protein [Flavobacterium sp. UBA4197]